ncbi:MAG: hypothetical protein ACRD0P_02725 [Stackebrandtia sp.]
MTKESGSALSGCFYCHVGVASAHDPTGGIGERRSVHVVENHVQRALEVHLSPIVEMGAVVLPGVDEVAEVFKSDATLDKI